MPNPSSDQLKSQTRDLWKECFHDSEAFMDLYFSRKYAQERNFHIDEGQRTVAAAQLLPYRTTLFGSVCGAGYVSGLSTTADRRGRGLAAELLRRMHRHEYASGGVLTVLIPGEESLRGFYQEVMHGHYETIAHRLQTELTPQTVADAGLVLSEPERWEHELSVYFELRTSALPFMLHPSSTDLSVAHENCRLAGGHLVVAHRREQVAGLCLFRPYGETQLMVETLVADDEKVQDTILSSMMQTYGKVALCRVSVPKGIEGGMPYAMGRVVNVKKFLHLYVQAHPDAELLIGVEGDQHVPENNGNYLLEKGGVHQTDRQPGLILNPGQLAAHFLEHEPFIMQLMLDE